MQKEEFAKVYDDPSDRIREASLSYTLSDSKDRRAARNILTKILEGEYSFIMEEISPYLLPFYKDLIPGRKTS